MMKCLSGLYQKAELFFACFFLVCFNLFGSSSIFYVLRIPDFQFCLVLTILLRKLFIRQGGSVFTLSDIQEMDAEVSSFTDLGTIEAGPLILAWAVFLCLLLSLPDRQNSGMLMVCVSYGCFF